MTERSPSVLSLLSNRSAAYVRRAPPDARTGRDRPPPRPESAPIDDAWFVEAVVTVDPEGRIPWRLLPSSVDLSRVRLVLGDRMVEVRSCDDPTGARRPDRQGRMHLPQGLLRAIGVKRGERVAVVRLDGQPVLGLVPARRLALRS